MAIIASYIVPHPPIAVSEVGGGKESAIAATLSSYQRVARAIAGHEPETIIFLDPHNSYYADWIMIAGGIDASGDMGDFGAPEVTSKLVYDNDLRGRIDEEANTYQITAGVSGDLPTPLDHGLMVPLYFIKEHLPLESFEAVVIGGSGLPSGTLLEFGGCLARAASDLDRRVVLVASGDLSHKLLPEGPYGFDPAGPKFDKAFCDVVESGSPRGFAHIDAGLAKAGAECGLSGFIMLAGAVEESSRLLGERFASELLSYEGPFGVGYGVAAYERLA